MSDWNVAKEGYTIAIVIIIFWMTIKFFRYHADRAESKKVEDAIKANTKTLEEVRQVLDRFIEFMEKRK